jgi:aminomethyltransferase
MSTPWQSPIYGSYKGKSTEEVRDGCVTAASYESQPAEYERLRRGIGLVDDNHYGKFEVKGTSALDVINSLTLADVSRLPINRMLASYMLKPDGSERCELFVVNQRDKYLVLTEGAPADEVFAALQEQCRADKRSATATDLTREVGLVGVDGPFAWELLKDLVGVGILGTRFLGVLENQSIDNEPVTILRAGKTGEFGYLLKVDVKNVGALWERLLDTGKEYDVKPCGLAAIDVCKLENRVINMQCEGRRARNALEMNCRYMVGRDKEVYVGSDAIQAALETGPQRRLIGLKIDWPGASASKVGPALDSEIQYQGTPIGILANSAFSHTLGKQIGLAFIETPLAYVGLDFTLKANGTSCPVRTVSAPFIMNRSLSIRPQEDSYKTARS